MRTGYSVRTRDGGAAGSDSCGSECVLWVGVVDRQLRPMSEPADCPAQKAKWTEAMAEQAPVVCDVLATIESRNWDLLARLLHEIHWTTQPKRSFMAPER